MEVNFIQYYQIITTSFSASFYIFISNQYICVCFIVLLIIVFPWWVAGKWEWETEDEEAGGAKQEHRVPTLKNLVQMLLST